MKTNSTRNRLFLLTFAVLALTFPGCGTPEVDSVTDRNISVLQTLAGQGTANDDDVAYLIERMTQGEAEERAVAAWAVGELQADGAADALAELAAKDDDLDVQVNAARSLARVGGTAAESTLLGLLESADSQVQGAALTGLAHPRFAGACDAICGWMKRAGDDLRPVAVDTLVTMAAPCTPRCLAEVAGDGLPEIRSLVAFGLGRQHDEESLEVLVGLLGDPDATVRANAAQALGMIGDPAARPHLEQASRDEYGIVQDAAKDALGKLP